MLASQNPKKRAGRKIFKETRHPIYRGVRSREYGKWVCEVRHPITQSRVWLGTHDTADMAARAHDVAVLALRGPTACINFADSVWRLPIPKSSDVLDIRKAAAEAAKAFRPIVEIAKIVYEVDEIFGMLGVIDSTMADGLMLPSPHTLGHGNIFDDVELFEDMSSWCSY
ncbi:dehydration-responsive element-binding factor 1 [Tanacetum coccineum]